MRSSDATRGALFARMATVLFLLVCVALRATSALDRLVVDLEEEKTEGVASPSVADPIKDMIEKNRQRKQKKAAAKAAAKAAERYAGVQCEFHVAESRNARDSAERAGRAHGCRRRNIF